MTSTTISTTLLMAEIEQSLPAGGDWCDLPKAQTLAAIVLALHPTRVVEIGVWLGGSLLPMLIAMRQISSADPNYVGACIAIDPWSAQASIAGETPTNVEWWGKVDHEAIYEAFCKRLDHHDVRRLCAIWRNPSDERTPPDPIDVLHIDGNHSDQAVRDVERFMPHVRVGGIAILDDVGWITGHVARGVEIARQMGFIDLYPLGSGLVMQRVCL
jgi:predicted O-methyltransferase YrrM